MSTKSKGFVHYFRAGIHFSERLFKNLVIQGKWIFKSSGKIHRWLLSFHSTPHESLTYIYGLVVVVIMMIIIMPVLGWAIIKSI
jgi:hypothetical protein